MTLEGHRGRGGKKTQKAAEIFAAQTSDEKTELFKSEDPQYQHTQEHLGNLGVKNLQLLKITTGTIF